MSTNTTSTISTTAASNDGSCKITGCFDPWNPNCPDYEAETLIQYYFWVLGVANFVIGAIGIVGNLFLSTVFLSKGHKSTFHANLVVLAVFDSGYILSQMVLSVIFIQEYLDKGTVPVDPRSYPSPAYSFLYPKGIWPLGNIFMAGSVYMTAVISIDRYVAIKHPFTSRFSVAFKKFNPVSSSSFKGSEKPIRNSRKATLSNLTAPVTKNNNQSLNTVDRKRVLVYALVVFILSTLVCFPMFFEYHVCVCPMTNEIAICETWLRKNHLYTWIYSLVFDMVIRFLIPLLVTMWTNVAIYRILKITDSCSDSKEGQVIAMLFGVAVPLVWCHTFRFASNLNQAIDLIIKSDCDNGKYNGVNTTGPGGFSLSARMLKTEIFVKFFLVLQSSVNCFIYLSASKGFREKTCSFYRRFVVCKSTDSSTKVVSQSSRLRVRKITDCSSNVVVGREDNLVFKDVDVYVIPKISRTNDRGVTFSN